MKSFKLWKWIFEFKLKRVRDEEKVIFLANQLLKEMVKQGLEVKGSCTNINLWIHSYEGVENQLTAENILQPISFKGKYEGVIK